MANGSRLQVWLPLRRPNPRARMRLFCLPYSGGSAAVFRNWTEALPDIDVCAVQYPGRSTRFSEPLARRMDELVEPLFREAVEPLLDVPFAMYGHSMGAVVAFELTRRVVHAGRPSPEVIMLGAHGPPRGTERLHKLSDAALLERLRTLNGTPPEFFANAELIELILPVVRADLEVVETYTMPPAADLDCPIVAFGSAGDCLAVPEVLEEWGATTRGPFSLMLFHGGHFFLQAAQASLLAEVARQCSAPRFRL